MFDRLELLIGDNIKKLEKKHILIVGIGGVGGYVLEALVRSGLYNISIVDSDTFDVTNLNRQILATTNTVNLPKVDIAVKRALTINSNCIINTYKEKLGEDTFKKIVVNNKYDFIIDACDDINAKVMLIKYAKDCKVPFISSMGTANRFKPELFKIVNLEKTYNDPLAKKLRMLLPKRYHNTKVLWSSELPLANGKKLGTLCSLPMAAGAIISSYVINELIK